MLSIFSSVWMNCSVPTIFAARRSASSRRFLITFISQYRIKKNNATWTSIPTGMRNGSRSMLPKMVPTIKMITSDQATPVKYRILRILENLQMRRVWGRKKNASEEAIMGLHSCVESLVFMLAGSMTRPRLEPLRMKVHWSEGRSNGRPSVPVHTIPVGANLAFIMLDRSRIVSRSALSSRSPDCVLTVIPNTLLQTDRHTNLDYYRASFLAIIIASKYSPFLNILLGMIPAFLNPALL